MNNIENVVQGYDGSRHAPSTEVAYNVKNRGHKKEYVFAERVGGDVVKGTQKPDVIKEENRYSVKGASANIQLLLLSCKKSEMFYGSDHPLYQYQLVAYNHKKFKFDNNNDINLELFETFKDSANVAAEWLLNKVNFRFVIEKVCSDDYDANKLVVLKEIDQDALVYNMRDVVNLYVRSNYKVHVTKGAKIVVSCDNKEIFYLEIRGSKGKIGSMNHGVRAPQFYSFLQKNLTYEIISK